MPIAPTAAAPTAVTLLAISRSPPERESAPASGRDVIHDDRQFLAQCNLFRVLPADERAKLIARAKIRKYAANKAIFLKGSTRDSIMVVLSGHVRISIARRKRDHLQGPRCRRKLWGNCHARWQGTLR
jgi:hypothetical protein